MILLKDYTFNLLGESFMILLKKTKELIETTMSVISSVPPPRNIAMNAQYDIPDYSLYLALKHRDDNAAVNIFNHCKKNKQPYLYGRMLAIASKPEWRDTLTTTMLIGEDRILAKSAYLSSLFDCCPNALQLDNVEKQKHLGRVSTPNFMGVVNGYRDYVRGVSSVTNDVAVAALKEADSLPRTVANDGSIIITLDPTAGPGDNPLVVVVSPAGGAFPPRRAAGAGAAGVGPRRRTRRNRRLKTSRRNRRSSRY